MALSIAWCPLSNLGAMRTMRARRGTDRSSMLQTRNWRPAIPSHIVGERLLSACGGSQRKAETTKLLVIGASIVSVTGKMKPGGL